ncbi:MAG: hypothetical protein IMZ71_03075, partial [Chloroflexi bacterium]|nr:hypothetical protein [Chloroflexota bacterium]
MNAEKLREVSPQPGPQYDFCASEARIVIYGGAAGGGKSYGLLMDAARYITDPTYNAMIFRRKYTEIVMPGALWDTSKTLYGKMGGEAVRGRTEWTWAGGSKVRFHHLNQEENVYDHQGGQYAYIGFDELTEFTQHQFFYLMTRNRPPEGCNVPPKIRGTCNPDADSWVAEFIAWWINQETGYPIPERSGKLQFFVMEDNKVKWVEPNYRDSDGNEPISVTFIAASLEDNPVLMQRDPTYKANLAGKDRVTRERLSKGNWKITFQGNVFDPTWFLYANERPKGVRFVRYWDLAATEVSEKDKNDPDWTAGVLCCIYENKFYICDIETFRTTPGKAEAKMREIAEADGPGVEQWWEEEKGASGKWANEYLKQIFNGFECHADPVSGSKVERALPWAAWAEFGRVVLVRGDWNKRLLGRAGKFPDGKRDEIDGGSGAFKALIGVKKIFDKYDSRHFQRFLREKNDFDKIQVQNIEVYLSLYLDKTGGVYGGCYVWSLVNQRCRLYNEIFLPQFTPQMLYDEIVDKLVVPITAKNQSIQLMKAIGNDEFFNAINENVSKLLKRKGVRIRPVRNYDETAAMLKANEMFGRNQIIVHEDCAETD